MPSYTHMQRAEPVLVAHWLLAYVAMIERDITRLADARRRMNLCPLGSGAVAGATLALDRTIAAEALGFSAPTQNSMDATSDRDFLLEFTQALATLGVHISRFAEEITLYSTAEFGFLDLPEAFLDGIERDAAEEEPGLYGTGTRQERAAGGCGDDAGCAAEGAAAGVQQGLQEGQEPVFDAADTVRGILGVLPAFTRSLQFNFERMKTAAATGYLNAGPAGGPGAGLRRGGHGARDSGDSACVHALAKVQLRADEDGGGDGLSERDGGGDLSLEQGRAVPQGARDRWQRGAAGVGERARAGCDSRWRSCRG